MTYPDFKQPIRASEPATKSGLLRAKGCFLLPAVLAWCIAAHPVAAQTSVLDDFCTGPYTKTLSSGRDDNRQPLLAPSVGPARLTSFVLPGNPHAGLARLDLSNGHAIVDVPFQGFAGLDLSYGFSDFGVITPLRLDLGMYRKFRINLIANGAGYGEPLTVNILVYQHNGYVYQGAANINPSYYPLGVDIDFDSFASNQRDAVRDFKDIDCIAFLFQARDSFGVQSLMAVN